MNYHWDWQVFSQPSPDGNGTYLETILNGLCWTLATAGAAWILALVLGVIVGALCTLRSHWVSRLAHGYIEVFRNIPLLVQMFLFYFVAPELLPRALGVWLKAYEYSAYVTAVVSLGFYTSARVAVQVSAGIRSLSRGQEMAALATGMTLWQSYRYVLLPQAVRIIVLPLTGEFVGVMKNSAVALTIGLMELTARTRAVTELSFQTFEPFIVATALYVLINLAVIYVMRRVDARFSTPRG
ncbi:ABC transporter permease subunit [Pandoraea fibrosis]|uniref:ABC transporter permease subunit n=1 Tax=Pandoraea fibrosis TaxID=1891094 RepID=A0ABX6HVI5_9BURK|nr:amino acid ABC transporter permease [Pandoraea fibrosis]QHE91510.1 ABC transporter permease subunit [Pandoraea fibrosis]QHF14932.1 ABC transporter permease subunit [Pandoraea fibrosis]